MFDKTTIVHRPTKIVDRHVTITENRAPTDDSVKLLREMEQAAFDNMICRGEIRNNTLAAQWTVFRDSSASMMDYKVIVRVKLNGNDHVIRFPMEHQRGQDEQAVVLEVRDKLAKLIAEQVITEAFHDMQLHSMVRQLTGGAA
jgi:hypothetical protein